VHGVELELLSAAVHTFNGSLSLSGAGKQGQSSQLPVKEVAKRLALTCIVKSLHQAKLTTCMYSSWKHIREVNSYKLGPCKQLSE